jgi:hypothetical protein
MNIEKQSRILVRTEFINISEYNSLINIEINKLEKEF